MRLSWLRLFWAGIMIIGAGVGYLVSSGHGERLLHDEIETQLSRLLSGPVQVGAVEVHREGGFHFVAADFEAFAGPTPEEVPILRARRIVARVNPFALLVGQLELSHLLLESPHLRLEPLPDGTFRRLPLPALSLGSLSDDHPSGPEILAHRIERLDQAANEFFEHADIASRIEIQEGAIHWVDPESGDERTDLRLELVDMTIDSDWLSNAASIDWTAVFVDGRHAPFSFEAQVHRGEDEPFSWRLQLTDLPLAAAETPLAFIEGIEGLEGRLTTELALKTTSEGSQQLTLQGTIDEGVIGFRRSGASLRRGTIELNAELLFYPGRVELRRAHIADTKLGLDVAATIERPLRAASPTYLESRMVGFELEDVFALVRSLETESDAVRGLGRLIERVEGGHVQSLAASGKAPWKDWIGLVSAKTNTLPKGLRFGGAFENVRLATGPGDRIEQLRGQIEWADDRMTLRDATATFRGVPLPQLHFVLNGTSALAQVDPDRALISTVPPPMPGLEALIDLLKPKNPDILPPVKAIGLAIDHIEHPLFRWPLHDLRLLIEPLRRGVEARIQDGSWGGVGISGEMVWFADPEGSTLSAEIDLGPGQPPSSPISAAKMSPEDPQKARWAKGQFELEFRPSPRLPFQKANGFFRFDGNRLVGNDVDFVIEPTGRLATRMVLDLSEAGVVGTEVSFALTDGRFEHLSEFIALPPGLVRGTLGAAGTLRGPIRAGRPLIRDLDGSVRAESKHGKIKKGLPLFLRLSKASEGYNPFANEDEIKYEQMSATIQFNQGTLSSENFEIEGPLRIYTRGRIDPFAGPADVRGLVGIFLFRAPNQILGNLPVVRHFLPGSKRGLVGAYFRVKGELAKPRVETLPMASLMTGVPEAIKAPFKILQYLFDLEGEPR